MPKSAVDPPREVARWRPRGTSASCGKRGGEVRDRLPRSPRRAARGAAWSAGSGTDPSCACSACRAIAASFSAQPGGGAPRGVRSSRPRRPRVRRRWPGSQRAACVDDGTWEPPIIADQARKHSGGCALISHRYSSMLMDDSCRRGDSDRRSPGTPRRAPPSRSSPRASASGSRPSRRGCAGSRRSGVIVGYRAMLDAEAIGQSALGVHRDHAARPGAARQRPRAARAPGRDRGVPLDRRRRELHALRAGRRRRAISRR